MGTQAGRSRTTMLRRAALGAVAALALLGAGCSSSDEAATSGTTAGTAGSTGLVLQTVLVPLMLADAPSRLVIEGGTHAMAAPPFEFLQKTLLPVLERMGPKLSITLERHGFYPRGGGRIVVDIDPAPLRPIECIDRGAFKAGKVEALVAGIPFDIADRELDAAHKVLAAWPGEAFAPVQLPAENGPGNALLMEAEFEHVTEIMSGFGRLGVPAERLAKTAAKRMAGYLASQAFAGPYLQDQLLLPFAMAGRGAFTTVKLSQHTRTAVNLIERFSSRSFRFSETTSGAHLAEVV